MITLRLLNFTTHFLRPDIAISACLSAPFSEKAGTPRAYPLASETSGSMTTPPGYPLLWR